MLSDIETKTSNEHISMIITTSILEIVNFKLFPLSTARVTARSELLRSKNCLFVYQMSELNNRERY